MKAARLLPLALVFVAVGCGGVVGAERPADGHGITALGFGVDPPAGWNVRILLGADGRPVLHAGDFALPANDDDRGEVTSEMIGPRQVYVNVRDLGPGEAEHSFPVTFERSDFPDAVRDVAAGGHVYRVTASSGSGGPSPEDLSRVNDFLSTLAVEPYKPEPSPPAEGERLSAHGVELALPAGWHGRVSPGVVQAASFELSQDADPREPPSPGPDDVAFTLVEVGGSDAPFVTARLPLQLAASEFVPQTEQLPALTGRSFTASGRKFLLWAYAGSRVPDATALEKANEALASLRVEPGDFYPGEVEPASFAPAAGWHTGSSGPVAIEPEGEQTSSWASTVLYRDNPNNFPPHDTLDALPPDGIAIVAWVSRHPGERSELPDRQPPFDLGDARQGSFEGIPPERGPYQIEAHVPGRFDVVIWIFFGREHPGDGQAERAQAELHRLQLPYG